MVDMRGGEFQAGLHHQPDDAGPGLRHIRRLERSQMGLQRFAGVDGIGWRDALPVLIGARAAGRGHFGADDIAEPRGIRGRCLADRGQTGGPFCRNLIVHLRRFACASFGTVKVDLGEAGSHIGAHQILGLGHGAVCGFAAPSLWAQMVSAEMYQFGVGPDLIGKVPDKGDEIGRLQSGIAAELVDLITGRLDQNGVLHLLRQRQRGAQDIRLRGTDGRDGDRGSGAVACVQVGKETHWVIP